MTKHKDDCPWKDGFHRSVSNSGIHPWEYELIVDESGVFYRVSMRTGSLPYERTTHSSDYFNFNFCPLCGVKVDKDDE